MSSGGGSIMTVIRVHAPGGVEALRLEDCRYSLRPIRRCAFCILIKGYAIVRQGLMAGRGASQRTTTHGFRSIPLDLALVQDYSRRLNITEKSALGLTARMPMK